MAAEGLGLPILIILWVSLKHGGIAGGQSGGGIKIDTCAIGIIVDADVGFSVAAGDDVVEAVVGRGIPNALVLAPGSPIESVVGGEDITAVGEGNGGGGTGGSGVEAIEIVAVVGDDIV